MAFQEKLIDALGSFATTFNSYRYIRWRSSLRLLP